MTPGYRSCLCESAVLMIVHFEVTEPGQFRRLVEISYIILPQSEPYTSILFGNLTLLFYSRFRCGTMTVEHILVISLISIARHAAGI